MANADQSDGRRMTIACDMTIYNAEALKDELMHELGLGAALELDLAQVGVIDSSGIQLLMLAKRESARQGRQMRIVAHSPAVCELFDFYNIVEFFGDPLLIPARNAD